MRLYIPKIKNVNSMLQCFCLTIDNVFMHCCTTVVWVVKEFLKHGNKNIKSTSVNDSRSTS